MKPKGFVAAASITSHTSTPSLSHTIAISLTSPMFTLRNVVSRILTSSAASVVDTGTRVSIAGAYSAVSTLRQVGVVPPSTLGVVAVFQLVVLGATRFWEHDE